jgi:tetratricopeptide (TPR) repeat protein
LATYKRLPRGKQKSTNEFVSFIEHAERWVAENFRQVVVGVVAAALIFVAVLGVRYYRGWHEDKAADALAQALRIDDAPARTEALTNVATNFGATTSVREAQALLGNEAYTRNAYAEAERWYRALADDAGNYPSLEVYALHQLGSVYAAQGVWERAAEAYRTARGVHGNLIMLESAFNEARCLEHLGRYDEARTRYQEIIATAKDVDLSLKAKSEERMLWLIAHQQSRG